MLLWSVSATYTVPSAATATPLSKAAGQSRNVPSGTYFFDDARHRVAARIGHVQRAVGSYSHAGRVCEATRGQGGKLALGADFLDVAGARIGYVHRAATVGRNASGVSEASAG
jgi:hypothetical protein